ncbi:SIR2 family protein [Tardiphaga sp. P9-11]|uniref:SIR2 family protein n=1 Tax=Tardiphaga sp. P9-11 TaxID=2024614 RepID=UPI0011F3D4A3|nr:SIR2 family protein [Tardiphaga sp. P9-11]KAA0075883.1 hypothetical protein CIW50_06305 [Tardiphaga sp. P9-11]
MKYVLLTGAGFSRNWGGWLAEEVFEYLIGQEEVGPRLKGRLWAHRDRREGFEDVLASLQWEAERPHSYDAEEDLRNLTGCLQRMFAEMNDALDRQQFNPNSFDLSISVTTLLSKFDAIFTLNQDTLLEAHYLGDAIGGKFTSCYRPGYEAHDEGVSIGGLIRPLFRPAQPPYSLVPNLQPYFKLHGSSDLIQERLITMIMGTGKSDAIQKTPLLKWSMEQFEQQLLTPFTRLMVIGYSFLDDHINKIILAAAKTGLQIYIIDFQGVNVIDQRGTDNGSTYMLYDELRNSLIGASRRPLLTTFSGNDKTEFDKIQKFFRPSLPYIMANQPK